MFHLTLAEPPFIVMLLIILATAKLFGEICERLGQPSMIGELLAGVILGPSVFNIIHGSSDLKVLADLGVFLLIVMAGMEIEVEEIRNSISGKNAWIAILGFIIPFISGTLVGIAFNFNYSFSIFLGLCIAITALPVSIRILIDLGRLNSDIGQRIISAAIFNDVLSLLVLGVILDFNDESKHLKDLVFSTSLTVLKVIVFMLFLIFAYKMFKLAKSKVNIVNPKVNKFLGYLRGRESLFAIVIVFVLAFASMAEFMHMHFIVGAFFGAILLPRSMFAKGDFEEVKRNTSGITMGFLAPIFFASMGIAFNITVINDFWLLIAVLGASFFSKIFGGYVGGRCAGFNSTKSLSLGFGLNARGIMELVIANIALQKGFISVPIFSILVIMAMLTTLLTPFFLKKAFRIIDRENESAIKNFS